MANDGWKKIVKNLVFLWGAISLGFIVVVIAFLMFSNITQSNKRQKKSDETIHEATFGDIKLHIILKYGDKEPEVFINLFQKDRKIVSDYQLPSNDAGFNYFDINNSIVTQYDPGKYRIILFSVSGDCDLTSNQVWFLKFDGKMNFVRVDELYDMRRLESAASLLIIGNKHFYLPDTEGYEYKAFVVPVELNVGEFISISPLLSDRGLSLLKADFEKDLSSRRDRLSKDPDQSKLKLLNKVQNSFFETLKGSRTAW